MAHHDLIIHPLVLRCVRVVRLADVTPRMRRITVSGEQLGAFSRDGQEFPEFATPGFDDHVKLIFASDGDVAAVLPTQLPLGIEWAPSDTRQGRDYTPTRFDPESQELDLDFVLHGDGPAATWAMHASVGDELWFAGPKSSTVFPTEVGWVLLAGDETAIPAITRFLQERPVDAPVRVIMTIAQEHAKQELPLRPTDRITWVRAEASNERALAEAVAKLQVPAGVPYVWAAAESRALLPLRKLARAFGAPKSHVNITGYWHHRDEAGAAATTDGVSALPESPTHWFALRAALQLGLLDALAAEPLTLDVLAERVGSTPSRLAPLADLLGQLSVIARLDGGLVCLDRLGEELCEDEHAQERYVGLEAEQVLALAELPGALRIGHAANAGDIAHQEHAHQEHAHQAVPSRAESAWHLGRGSTFRASVEAEPEYFVELMEQASGLPHVLAGLARQPVWEQRERILVTGPGALEIADALHAGLPQERARPSLIIHETAGPLAVLRAGAGSRPGPGSAAEVLSYTTELPEDLDLVVTALALGHRTDAEAIELLRTLASGATHAVLIERLTPDGLSPAASATQALVDFATLGTPTRTPEATLRLVESAGWTVRGREKLGWGIESVELSVSAPGS